MKLRIDRAPLAEAAVWVAQAIQKNPTHPAMAGLKITAGDDGVTLSGFNYETAHTATLDADVLEAGEALVSAKFAAEILGALKVAEVELVTDDTRLTINAGRSSYRVATMRIEDYPHLPNAPAKVARIDAPHLVNMIARVEHAASRDASLDILTAVNLVSDGDTLTAVTTDRYRIARASAACPGSPFTANVPATSVTAAVKALTGVVEIGCENGVLSLADQHRSIITRLIEKDHTNVSTFFDTPTKVEVTVPADEFVAAVKRAKLVISDRAKDTLELKVDPDNGELAIVADSDTGDGSENLQVEADGAITVFVSANHVIQAASLIDGDARIRFREPAKPAVISPTTDDSYAFVVMPRRTL